MWIYLEFPFEKREGGIKKLLIKQRVFSWSDTYDVYDENGNIRYLVKAEFLTLGHRFHALRVKKRLRCFVKDT